MSAAVLLINPKNPVNVGGVIRACAQLGASQMRWTGARVLDPRNERPHAHRRLEPGAPKDRFPREERLREYNDRVEWSHVGSHLEARPVDQFVRWGVTPVCIELVDGAEQLPDFEHPERAVYVFGPEDGGVPKGIRLACHRFVEIPAQGCLNLAAAVNVVLYDRLAKARVLA